MDCFLLCCRITDWQTNSVLSLIELINNNYISFWNRGEKTHRLFMGQWVYQLVRARIFQRLIRNPCWITIHCFAPMRIPNLISYWGSDWSPWGAGEVAYGAQDESRQRNCWRSGTLVSLIGFFLQTIIIFPFGLGERKHQNCLLIGWSANRIRFSHWPSFLLRFSEAINSNYISFRNRGEKTYGLFIALLIGKPNSVLSLASFYKQ